MHLEDKTVIVSGVGPGLGREIALAAAHAGAAVVLGARRAETLRTVSAEIRASGGRADYIATDITKPDQVAALIDLAVTQFGGVDGLVNCAALDTVLGGLEATTDEQWRQLFEVNVFATMDVIRTALPALKVRGGSIVFIGSQQWLRPASDMLQLAYGASKGAQVSAMYGLAVELGPYKIRVNTVAPSWMWGPPMEGYVAWQAHNRKIPAAEVRAGLDAKAPLGELASDGDVAAAVVFLLGDGSRSISGQSLLVNAGEHVR